MEFQKWCSILEFNSESAWRHKYPFGSFGKARSQGRTINTELVDFKGVTMSVMTTFRALANEASVKEFSVHLLGLADTSQKALHRLAESDSNFVASAYGILVEVYGLRTRAYTLMNDSANHVVDSLEFSQANLLELMERVSHLIKLAGSHSVANSLVVSMATFSISLSRDKAKVVNFLFQSICDDLDAWERTTS